MATPTVVKDMALVDAPSSALSIFERLASSGMNVDNLGRLMALHERMAAKQAEEAFNAAMSDAQSEMRPISADATNPQTHSRYASYAKLDSALRPIYTKHGFGLSFNTTDATKDSHIRVLCYVTHAAGHAKEYRVDMPADGKGAKGGDVMTLTHAFGAGVSYGMRYLLKMVFNVAVGEDDRDGNTPKEKPQPPKNYDDLMAVFETSADDGYAASRAAFADLPEAVRMFALKHDKSTLERIKAKAQKADKAVKS